MDHSMNGFTGFVFARGGSKGIAQKNLQKIGGVSLIGHSVRTGLASRAIDTMMVSTDCPAIAEEAKRHGAVVPFMRPAELAQDDSPEWLAWRHAIETMDRQGTPLDLFISLPATSPLRIADDVDQCIELFLQGDCDMVITATETARHPSFNMITEDEHGYSDLAVPPKAGAFVRRQDVPPIFDMTTVAYVADPAFIMEKNAIFEGRIKSVFIPQERALDVDSPFDLKIAELIFNDYSSIKEKP